MICLSQGRQMGRPNGTRPRLPLAILVIPWLALLLCLSLAAPRAIAAPGPHFTATPPLLIPDAGHVLTPAEVLGQARRSTTESQPPIPTDVGHYWWAVRITNLGGDPAFLLDVGNTAIEAVGFYLFTEDGASLDEQHIDLLALAASGEPDTVIGHHIPFEVPSGASRFVLLSVEAPIAHRGLLQVRNAASAVRINALQYQLILGATGAMAALIVYNLFLGLSLRDLNYLIYAGHAVGLLIYLLTALGFIGSTVPAMGRYLIANMPGIALGDLFGALFIYRFLDLGRTLPGLGRVLILFIAFVLCGPLLYLLLGLHDYLTVLRSGHLLLLPLVLVAGLLGVRRQIQQARYILVGWGVMSAMTFYGMLGVLGVTELSVNAGIVAFLGVLFEMFLLSLALADRVRRLQRDKAAAEHAAEAKARFLATMSHEIRTPLNGVLGMAESLRRTELSPRQREYVEAIQHSGSALLVVLNDILELVKISAHGVALTPTRFAPGELIEDMTQLMLPRATEKGIELSWTLEPSAPQTLVGDVERLRQVLLNLIGNAVKFTHEGGVEVRYETLSPTEEGRAHVCFMVRDTGIGIPRNELPRLFSQFHQVEQSAGHPYSGAGLGLAITKELVDAMGGSIEVWSEPGIGSRFVVGLTLNTGTEAVALPGADPDPPAESSPSPLRVLVIDDDAINRMLLEHLLGDDGHLVFSVDNGERGIELVSGGGFDIVLTGVRMPGLNGRELASRLRQAGSRIPIIGLTAETSAEEREHCLQAGMDQVVHKPIVMPALYEGIHLALRRTPRHPPPADALPGRLN